MNNTLIKAFGLLLSLLLVSCQDYTPKPIGYPRIERKEITNAELNFGLFSFQYPTDIRIDTLQSPNQNEIWFNIVYPQYNAIVYCTYLPISKKSLNKALNDSYHMAYSHTLMANDIEQKLFNSHTNNVSGVLYEIGGNVATPLQFFVTDSINHFLRGSLYYSSKTNSDSVAPITQFITKDVEQMMSSFKWEEAISK